MEGMDAWISRVCGDQQPYKPKEGGDSGPSYAVNVLRSLRWPGAVSVAKGSQHCSIYLGDGIKRGESSFHPTDVPEVCKDPQGQQEEPEPTPLHSPKKAEEGELENAEEGGEEGQE